MSKETVKQIKARLVNDVRKQYESKLQDLNNKLIYWKQRSNKYESECEALVQDNNRLKNENEILRDKLSQYEDWIIRMQEFCNLKDSERPQAFKMYIEGIQEKSNKDKEIANALAFTRRMLSIFSI